MGYQTDFEGRLEISPPLNATQVGVINRFSEARHGSDSMEFMFAFWCNWVATPDGKYLEWNGAEKFYCYIAWLHHLNLMFFTRWQVVLSGEITWEGEDEKDVGVIRATPVTREDGIRTTDITPPPPPSQLRPRLDGEDLDNCFLLFPGIVDIRSKADPKLKQLEASARGEAGSLLASTRCGWKLDGIECVKKFVKWEGGEDLHGCIGWLHWLVNILSRWRTGYDIGMDDPEDSCLKQLLFGSVALPGGLVITAQPVSRNGKFVNSIKLSSPLLESPLSPGPSAGEATGNSLAIFGWDSLLDCAEDLSLFLRHTHADEQTSEAWIVPESVRCGWRFLISNHYGQLVWRGGDGELQGCVHWLHHLNERFFLRRGVLLMGSLKLPNGVVVKAEVERRGRFCYTRITPDLPSYDFVKVGGEVKLIEVDSTREQEVSRTPAAKRKRGSDDV